MNITHIIICNNVARCYFISQWRSVAQRNKLPQALATKVTLGPLLVLVCYWSWWKWDKYWISPIFRMNILNISVLQGFDIVIFCSVHIFIWTIIIKGGSYLVFLAYLLLHSEWEKINTHSSKMPWRYQSVS